MSERRRDYEKRPDDVRDIFLEGARRAREVTEATMTDVRAAVKLPEGERAMNGTELYIGPSADDDGRIEPRYHVRLPVFDGPMDLLLHLIRKNEVDIYDIPIAEITRQYLETLELMEELNIDLASEFLVMAATLIHIKSKMLLPPPHEDGTTDELGEDPRNELVARLLEYQRYKEAAQQLHQQEEVRAAIWIRPEEAMHPGTNGHKETPDDGLVEVDLFELISAFREVLERVRQTRGPGLRTGSDLDRGDDRAREETPRSGVSVVLRRPLRGGPRSRDGHRDVSRDPGAHPASRDPDLQENLFGPIHVQRLGESN